MIVQQPFIRDSIGETLLIPLYMKYLEAQCLDPILYDKSAVELVGKINYDFSKFNTAVNSAVGVAIRARYFDKLLVSFIENNPMPIIVIVGCGLDSRYERIGSKADAAIFYQLDIPEVMHIRDQLIPSHENETYLSASMLDTFWMDKLGSKHPCGQFLFIIEGVLMYFEEEEVRTVFQHLAQRFPKGELLFDIVGEWMRDHSHLHDTVKFMNAGFKSGTDDCHKMECWADNLEFVSSRFYTDFEEWKRTGFWGWFMQVVPMYRNSGRLLHYRIN
ncbi:MAG: class I SAM-dependent methyltransferase [Bacteroidota bacterium]